MGTDWKRTAAVITGRPLSPPLKFRLAPAATRISQPLARKAFKSSVELITAAIPKIQFLNPGQG